MKYIKYILLLFLIACETELTNINYDDYIGSNLNDFEKLDNNTKKSIEGIYKVEEGSNRFGDNVILKWTGDLLSIFADFTVYGIMNHGIRNDSILFEGFWRYSTGSQIGSLTLNINTIKIDQSGQPASIELNGIFISGDGEEKKTIKLSYSERIKKYLDDFYIIAHRGGGRNSDRLPASENSIELIKLAQRYGANGIEIDVKLTKDNVPILYHDENLNMRLIQQSYLIGNIENYSYSQLYNYVTLKNGEKIPTLEEALDAVIFETDLKLVWLDLKSTGVIQHIKEIQKKYNELAKSEKRDVEILLGIPSDDLYNEYKSLENKKYYPAICELDLNKTLDIDADIWAPRWTLGLQDDAINTIHSEKKRAFTWTLDQQKFIRIYLKDSKFDGILTNYPAVAAYEFYIKE